NLLTLRADDTARIRDVARPLAVKRARDLVRRRQLVIDAGVDPVRRTVERVGKAQLARSGIRARCLRGWPQRQELLCDRTDLRTRDPVERNHRGRPGDVNLLARVQTGARTIEAGRAQPRQITGSEGRTRYRDSGDGKTSIRTNPLVIGKEEQLVPDDRAADGAAKFVLIERVLRPAAIFEIVTRIEPVVAVVHVGRSAKRIRPRLRDRDEDA